MKERAITPEQLKTLYERESVPDRKHLREHLLFLVKARWAVEKVRKEHIPEEWETLVIGYDRYQPTANLLDQVIFHTYLEVLATNDPDFVDQVHHDFQVLRRLLNEGETLEEKRVA